MRSHGYFHVHVHVLYTCNAERDTRRRASTCSLPNPCYMTTHAMQCKVGPGRVQRQSPCMNLVQTRQSGTGLSSSEPWRLRGPRHGCCNLFTSPHRTESSESYHFGEVVSREHSRSQLIADICSSETSPPRSLAPRLVCACAWDCRTQCQLVCRVVTSDVPGA